MTRQNHAPSSGALSREKAGMIRRLRKLTDHGEDALTLLREDHRNVKKLFKEFEKAARSPDGGGEKAGLVARICAELALHASAEEAIVYPAARAALGDAELMDEADVEQAGAKALVGQLERMKPGDDHYDAKVIVLAEYVTHHIHEEERKIFPKMRKAGVDTAALGRKLIQYKRQYDAESGARPMFGASVPPTF